MKTIKALIIAVMILTSLWAGIGIGSYFRVEVDSLWSLKKRINCIGGQNHLKCEDLLMGSRWIAISDEALARFFEE